MPPLKENKSLYGALLAILATIIWSGNFVIARGVIKDIPPVTLSFYRWLTATVILLPFAYKYFFKEWRLVWKYPILFFLAAAFGISLFNTFVYVAGHHTSAVNMALIGTTSSPVMSVVLARIFLKEKVTTLRVTGMLVCILGILLLLSKGHLENILTLSFTEGDYWMLAAAFCFAVYNICARKRPQEMNPVNFLFTVFAIGTLILLPAYIMEYKSQGGIVVNWANTGAILYLGLGASVICFLLWNIAIHHLGAGRTSLFGNLIPVFSTLEAVWLLGEKVQWLHVISFALVVLGLIIANTSRKHFPSRSAKL
ncbi:MAG: DMT family transporter [Chitinophagaceae bacterium]|nr:DMT family transporter [Chitinophagaceae bacterium]